MVITFRRPLQVGSGIGLKEDGNMGQYALGQPVPRSEDPRLLRGGGRYVDDVTLPNMAYGYVLRSPHAAARIKRMDIGAARQGGKLP